MIAHATEWLHLVVRWIHFITGVAWIGASFYFNWLENRLDRRAPREGLAGNLWAVHGGGFYYLEKYKVAPPKLPEELHWFKWEAYFTWISGIALLGIVYYVNPATYLIDPSVHELSGAAAVGIGAGSLVLGWLVYDGLCRTPLVDKGLPFAVTIFLLLTGAAWGLSELLSARAAFLHVGAIVGTIMVANVFRVIIPSQKELVRAAEEGRPPDGAFGARALKRSRHNNYFTLPVLFIMLSNHFPGVYGHAWGWIVLAAVSLVGVAVRHYFNVRHQAPGAVWILPASVVALVAIAAATAPPRPAPAAAAGGSPKPAVTFRQVRAVIEMRCVSCHSKSATDDVFRAAPNGVAFDEPHEITRYAEKIHQRVVLLKNMPLGNKTGVTEDERTLLGRWFEAGAPAD